jgi:hypothetical protein
VPAVVVQVVPSLQLLSHGFLRRAAAVRLRRRVRRPAVSSERIDAAGNSSATAR